MTGLSASDPSAGGRRFWVSVVIFALINVTVWAGYHRWRESVQPRKDILLVQAFSPAEGEVVGGNGPVMLTWTFNLDVGKPGAVKAGAGGGMPGTLSPAVKGEWLWTDARTLTFEAQEKLPRATKFTAALNPGVLRSPAGYTLRKAEVHTFSTAPLELVGIRQAAFDGEDRVLLEIEFNDKVIPGEVMQHLQIEGPDGKAVKATLHGDGAGTIVRVLTDTVPLGVPLTAGQNRPVPVEEVAAEGRVQSRQHSAAQIVAGVGNPRQSNTLWATITPGLAGASGPLGIAEAVSKAVPVANVLMAESLGATVPSEGSPWLRLCLNGEIAQECRETIRGMLSVEPAVAFTADFNWDTRSISLHGGFAPGTRYAVKIGKLETGDDARKYPRPTMLSVFVPERDPAVYFENVNGYLGSKGNRMVLVKAVNVGGVRIRADRVYENNLVGWQNVDRNSGGVTDAEPFAHPVAVRHYGLPTKKNQVQELRVDLDELLGKAAAGEGVYRLTLAMDDPRGNDGDNSAEDGEQQSRFWHRAESFGTGENQTSVVTLSDIGLTAKLMAGNEGTEQALLAWAVSLSSGKALADVKVRVYSDRNQLLGEGVTDGEGVVRVEHVNPALDERASVVIAEGTGEGGKSITWLNLMGGRRDESGFATSGRAYLRSGYEAFVWAERGVYRPGETVVLRAIVRGAGMKTSPEKMPVRWQIRRPDGRDGENKTVMLDADGAGEWRVTFPSDAQTGWWEVKVGLPGETGAGSSGMKVFGEREFQIEEFIPDRIKMGVTLGGPGLAKGEGRLELGKGPLLADVQGDYLFGQPAAGLQSQISVQIWGTRFVTEKFPESEGWVAGDTAKAGEVLASGRKEAGDHVEVGAQTLDAAGHTQFEVDVAKKLMEKPEAGSKEQEGEGANGGEIAASELYAFKGPWSLGVTGNVVEMGGRAVSAVELATADGLPYYVMARAVGKSGYAEVGKAGDYEAALVTPKGEMAAGDAGRVRVRVYREMWVNTFVRREGRYQYDSARKLEEVKGAAVKGEGGKWSWTPVMAGSYVLEFADAATKQATTLRVYAGDGSGWSDNVDRTNPERVEMELVGEKSEEKREKSESGEAMFRVGEEVKAIVRSPFAGRLLLTVETDRVLLTKVVEMTGTAAEVTFAVPEGSWPNGYVAATVVRAVDPTKEWRTHRGYGVARFVVDDADRRLKVGIQAVAELRPSKTLDVELAVTDAKGEAVGNAAVAVAAVDEGILRLTGYATPDPLAAFDRVRGLGVETSDLYGSLMPEVAKLEGASKAGGGEDSAGFQRRHTSPVSGKRVKPVSLVSEIVHTGADGKAVVHVQVPEFLGQLRVMAVAYRGELMGDGERKVVVRSPLVVQTSFPRFLAPGDRVEVTALVINNSQASGTARLKMTTDGVLAFEKDSAEVPLKANEQKVVTFQLRAKEAVGVGQIAVEGAMGEESYGEHLEVPVRAASPEITRGGYLTAEAGKDLAVEIPGGMLAGTQALEVRVGQRPVLGIPAGLAYLDHYPYGCVEQTTSQCFPLVYLSDIGGEIEPGMFAQERISRKVQAGITRLIGMQTGSGGLSMWPGGTEDWEWGTVYAAHFLAEAEKAGYVVPEDFKARLAVYVRSLLLKNPDGAGSVEVHAYAAYVMALWGKADRAVMNRLGEILDQEEKAGKESGRSARFYLALAWAAAGRTDLAEKMIPEQLPLPRTGRELGGNVGSPVRDQALLVTTLLAVSPEHAGLPGLVERLAEAGKSGQWRSTQDNAWGVMAMGKYLRSVKDVKGFESAELLDGEKVLETAAGVKGLVWTEKSEASSQKPEAQKLRVRVKGEVGAKAYVSWLESGVPSAMPGDADHALKVRREYLTEEGKPLDATTLMSGTAVKVKVTVESAAALSHVVVEDLLPAGLEVENPRLATSEKQAGETERPLAVDRLDVRDDRVVVIGNVPAGVSRWSYLARAVTPGVYTVPPVRGECMYDPGINSISGGGGRMTVMAVKAVVKGSE